MKRWAIFHIPSGKFLGYGGKRAYGGTYAEPVAPHKARLFGSKGGAKNALRWWLEGYASWTLYRTEYGYERNELKSDPAPDRFANEMKIVEFDLIPCKEENR
jgi:hypothetical protein